MADQVPDVRNAGVTARLDTIRQKLRQNPDAAALAPGLLPTLETYVDKGLKPQELLRSLLEVYRDSDVDTAYQDTVAALTDDERSRLERFVEGKESIEKAGQGFKVPSSMAARHEMTALCSTHHAVVSADKHQFFKFEKTGDLISKVEFVPESSDTLHKFASWIKGLLHIEHKGEVKVC